MIEWAIEEYKKHMSMTADLVVLLDRERTEVERLKELVKFLQRQCNESFEQGRASATVAVSEIQALKREYENLMVLYSESRQQWFEGISQRDSATKQVETLRLEVQKLRATKTPDPESFDLYHAQNQIDLLRTIRRSQGEGITKLRQQLTEACTERDSASRRAESWRKAYNDVIIRLRKARKLFVELRDERDVAREGLAPARRANCGLDQDRQKLYQKMDRLQIDLDVSRGIATAWHNEALQHRHNETLRQHGYANPRLEMILEESYRNEFKRNIDNQKVTDAPNCPSS